MGYLGNKIERFQFLIGRLGTISDMENQESIGMFQFLIGRLGTIAALKTDLAAASFNSS